MSLRAPVPSYPAVGRGAFASVYEPDDDTYLLLDALHQAQLHRAGVEVCLEVGSGSGVVSAFLASVIGPRALYLCTDLNPQAAACTLETAARNRVLVQPVVTDLVGGLLPRLRGAVDLLVFNPPYVPTPPQEVGSPGIASAWAGGRDGRQVTDRLLPAAAELLSAGGLFFLVALRENGPEDILATMEAAGLPGSVALSKQAGAESLCVLRFQRPAPGPPASPK
ncbi:methyltransferase N6AMT1 isoform X2 [Tachyglossus aculeatus]|uniref:methyltransferase N6AMT1 isoform X2 n=1 Tax=Tachyglossus aculeatus TaxID=9261 RepID=UPI0018F42B44|nr:methyltransferase N6AMT1 isoform X2 [Tachyglossus aculeatus]